MADLNAATDGSSPPLLQEGRGDLLAPRRGVPTGALVLADGTVIWGQGLGAPGHHVGELCFNTAMTGYQEILTDPSYAAQIIVFTFPHIGNVGVNTEDMEAQIPAVKGCVLRADITPAANFRAQDDLDGWLTRHGIVALSGVDTRALTRRLREAGFINAVIAHAPDGIFDLTALDRQATDWRGLQGTDLAKDVTTAEMLRWNETSWRPDMGYGTQDAPRFHVVALDYGIKRNMMRHLAGLGCRVTVMPATSAAEAVLSQNPDGLLLSNGPGDPAATGDYALAPIRTLIDSGLPVLGICLGHQLLALALGARTAKMHQGHHGANHPVKDLATGRVEITSMNHGFQVDRTSLPDGVIETHVSLFDGSNCGLAVMERPVFSVQYHPEASPGPHDSLNIFDRFVSLMEKHPRRTHP